MYDNGLQYIILLLDKWSIVIWWPQCDFDLSHLFVTITDMKIYFLLFESQFCKNLELNVCFECMF